MGELYFNKAVKTSKGFKSKCLRMTRRVAYKTGDVNIFGRWKSGGGGVTD